MTPPCPITLSLLAALAIGATPAVATAGDVRLGHTDRPPLALDPGLFPENTIYLYWDEGNEGRMHQIHPVTSAPVGRPLDFDDQHFLSNVRDDASSVTWNLPPGVLVVLYQDTAGRGRQLVLWGKGRYRTLEQFDFNDKVSRWAWYYVGGAPHPPTAPSLTPPYGSSHLTAAIGDTIEIRQHWDLGGRRATIKDVTDHQPAARRRIPGELADRMSSMRWSLPPGVVVLFTEHADGSGRQVAIWGQGEVLRLLEWDFNDIASRWSWFYLGDATPPPAQAPAPKRGACENCGLVVELTEEINYCPYCGDAWNHDRAESWRFCPGCGTARPEGEVWEFCASCGIAWGERTE